MGSNEGNSVRGGRRKLRTHHHLLKTLFDYTLLVIIGSVISAAMMAFLVYLSDHKPTFHNILGGTFDSIASRDETYHSLFLSCVSNLLAFLAVSVVVGIKQTLDANPRSLKVDEKISLLINHNITDKNPNQLEYLTEIIEDKLIFCPSFNYTVNFTDYIKELGALKSYIRTTRTLTNMSYESQKNKPIPYDIFTDGIVDSEGLQGEIISSRVINGGRPKELFNRPQPINKETYNYEHYADFGAGETKTIDALYWLYYKVDETFFTTRARYTYDITFDIENTSGISLVIKNLVDGTSLILGDGGHTQISVKRDHRSLELPREIFSMHLHL